MWERSQVKPLARHYGAVVRFLGYDPRPVGDDLPGRLNAIRRRLGLTQAELAARAGFDEGSLCRWESGRRRPSRWMAARVEAILEKLEGEAAASIGAQPVHDGHPDLGQNLTFFDLTRWRRKPPPGLLPEKVATLGDRIRQRRLELGLSQEALGKRFGVGRVTVDRWERGEDSPTPAQMGAVVAYLGSSQSQVRRRNRA